ncbi:chitinase [Fistulina hepatica ATCC 64428]|nr:chitinase [Fistulina hepatica ATCC 64428]
MIITSIETKNNRPTVSPRGRTDTKRAGEDGLWYRTASLTTRVPTALGVKTPRRGSTAAAWLCKTCADLVVASYYAGYHYNATPPFTLEDVPWTRYTHLTYAFAETTANMSLDLSASDPDVLPDFVSMAHEHNITASVSIGGWTGSRYWSTAVGSAENRTKFVKIVSDFAKDYDLDGLDFDWEYPGDQGIGCNAISANDTDNFLLFLQELRQDSVGADLILTAATAIKPFYNASGSPSTNVTAFSEVLNFVMVMNYDIWGPWSATAGPNAPLNDSCASAADQQGSAVSAVNSWMNAGMPANQIVLGIAAYGHSYTVNSTDAYPNNTWELGLYPAFNSSDRRLGDSWDDPAGYDECGVYEQAGGIYTFAGLVRDGFLGEEGDPMAGIAYVFDECSQTSFIYNETAQLYVSFDDADSVAAKGEFIIDNGLRGFSIWETGGDYNNILLNSILDAMCID